jgi:ER membrane protein SH3
MGFRTGFVLVSVSFLSGVLFIASLYDFPLLYSQHDKHDLDVALKFYLSLFQAPTAVSALLHGMIGLGLIGLLAKLHRWTETAKWFDGVSLGELA